MNGQPDRSLSAHLKRVSPVSITSLDHHAQNDFEDGQSPLKARSPRCKPGQNFGSLECEPGELLVA